MKHTGFSPLAKFAKSAVRAIAPSSATRGALHRYQAPASAPARPWGALGKLSYAGLQVHDEVCGRSSSWSMPRIRSRIIGQGEAAFARARAPCMRTATEYVECFTLDHASHEKVALDRRHSTTTHGRTDSVLPTHVASCTSSLHAHVMDQETHGFEIALGCAPYRTSSSGWSRALASLGPSPHPRCSPDPRTAGQRVMRTARRGAQQRCL